MINPVLLVSLVLFGFVIKKGRKQLLSILIVEIGLPNQEWPKALSSKLYYSFPAFLITDK